MSLIHKRVNINPMDENGANEMLNPSCPLALDWDGLDYLLRVWSLCGPQMLHQLTIRDRSRSGPLT